MGKQRGARTATPGTQAKGTPWMCPPTGPRLGHTGARGLESICLYWLQGCTGSGQGSDLVESSNVNTLHLQTGRLVVTRGLVSESPTHLARGSCGTPLHL